MSSRSTVNMLRTRRRDNNVKPNRRDFRTGRLDRKASRGMIYENEELRLRTININAEIERGQYDIKKLKRENELLKKEIWCLRDEYEKLDKLLKEKEIDFSSSSTTTSESESCSSCIEEVEDVERHQNSENVNKTNLTLFNRNFEALSVVPEESTDNSERTSNRTSLVNDQLPHDDDILQADQSYPSYDPNSTYRSLGGVNDRLGNSVPDRAPECNERISAHYEDDKLATCNGLGESQYLQHISRKKVNTDATEYYQNIVLVPRLKTYSECETLEKKGTDVIVKIDNRNFIPEPNGEGGEYTTHFADDFPRYGEHFPTPSHSTFSNGGNLEELLNDIETISQDILAISNPNDYVNFTARRCKSDIDPDNRAAIPENEKPFKSELNVTLMPQPMALIGLDKYRDIVNRTPSKSLENLSNKGLQIYQDQDRHVSNQKDFEHHPQSASQTPDSLPPPFTPLNNIMDSPTTQIQGPNFQAYLANLQDNYVNSDYFARYNQRNFRQENERREEAEKQKNCKTNDSMRKEGFAKILSKQISIDIPSSENDENSKVKPDISFQNPAETHSPEKSETKEEKQKVGLRKKVSIHFRGKREKQKKIAETAIPAKKISPTRDKKAQVTKSEDSKLEKSKINHQKTASRDSNKTTSDSDTKNNPESKKLPDKIENQKKHQKSSSVSPDRRKIKEDKKCKKHKKDATRVRRATVTSLESGDQRGRSHSVGTDRSNTYGGSHFVFDDYMLNSERDSMSSCETLKNRQMNFSNIPIGGKVPWCGCWGNGCI